ncbi:hypothetical protein WN51_03494 [Melipona quadrifasciata]|uniref:Uncharacterized protein n=1 Tax=Melipona quadrifasciata TaxID=166423 RepID=A0A0M8ZU81_9HYME|nr:hypothetical protein WN51_03494 [Melipona quadrifasciata]
MLLLYNFESNTAAKRLVLSDSGMVQSAANQLLLAQRKSAGAGGFDSEINLKPHENIWREEAKSTIKCNRYFLTMATMHQWTGCVSGPHISDDLYPETRNWTSYMPRNVHIQYRSSAIAAVQKRLAVDLGQLLISQKFQTIVKLLPGNSKKILFQNGLTNSENDSINVYTPLVWGPDSAKSKPKVAQIKNSSLKIATAHVAFVTIYKNRFINQYITCFHKEGGNEITVECSCNTANTASRNKLTISTLIGFTVGWFKKKEVIKLNRQNEDKMEKAARKKLPSPPCPPPGHPALPLIVKSQRHTLMNFVETRQTYVYFSSRSSNFQAETHEAPVYSPQIFLNAIQTLTDVGLARLSTMRRYANPPTSIVKCPSSMLQHMETLKAILTKAAASMDEPSITGCKSIDAGKRPTISSILVRDLGENEILLYHEVIDSTANEYSIVLVKIELNGFDLRKNTGTKLKETGRNKQQICRTIPWCALEILSEKPFKDNFTDYEKSYSMIVEGSFEKAANIQSASPVDSTSHLDCHSKSKNSYSTDISSVSHT